MTATKTCPACGGSFTRPSRRAWKEWETQRFCSRECAGADRTRPATERFNKSYVADACGCLLWVKAKNDDGYGIFFDGEKIVRASRFSCERVYDPLPPSVHVRHVCDTPACVNPAHLIPGTRMDNILDAVAKRRHTHGSRTHIAKLDEIAVARGRVLGMTTAAFASRFGVSQSAAYLALSSRSWRHVRALWERPSRQPSPERFDEMVIPLPRRRAAG